MKRASSLARGCATVCCTVLASTFLAVSSVGAQTKLLRFPDIHGDRVVFTYAGDLWIAPATGGTAIRLTAHSGLELFAKFSPDGKWIAFTGQYDGDEQVYVMPAAGGVPKQLTFYPARGPLAERWGYDNQVYGWTPDGERILFRSWRDAWTLPEPRLYTVRAAGGPAEPLPMPVAGAGDYAPDGESIVYSPVFRDFRSEKRYAGGQANDLYVFEVAAKHARRITDHVRADRDPMWSGGTIYFNSDRDGTFNLYAYDVARGTTAQVTRSRTWDVRWPSADASGHVVFELGGELEILDARTGHATPISIMVPDDGVAARPARLNAGDRVSAFALSPKGERALFVARGDVFTAPIEQGPTRNLTRSSGVHDKHARWSPDGARIAFISDRTGEEELYVVAQDGSGEAQQLTRGGRAMRYPPAWAPDGKRLTFSDKDGKLYVLTLDDRSLSEIADDRRGQILDYAWSPRGNHLAFSMSVTEGVRAIYMWSAEDGRARRVTDSTFTAYSPAWEPDGSYLYYLSDREYAPQISSVEWNYAGNRTTRIYAMALRRDVQHPFPPRSDEVAVEGADSARAGQGEGGKAGSGGPAKGQQEPAAGQEKAEGPAAPLRIDFDGIASRVAMVPLEAENISELSATKGHLLYAVSGPFYYGRESDRKTALRIFAFEDRKESTLAEDISGYALSEDGKKVLVRQGRSFSLYDAKPNAGSSKKAVATTGLAVDRVPREEWAQIFDEVWRRYRDFFYAENMHGYDWEALGRQYRPLLAHVAHRSDLNYVISEMVAELTVQHAYIAGGDWTAPERPKVALAGARFERDPASGRFRIAKIFRGQNEEPIYRSPLTEIGVNVSEGDYVLAIDGEELRGDDDPYRLLRHQAERPVTFTVNGVPRMEGARTVTFQPITSESDLVYLEWVTRNRQRVDSLSGGRVGYLHVPDMGAAGIREFIKGFYPQIRKDALIVDVRANGGGNVSQMLIERLRRDLLATGFSRTNDEATTYPYTVFTGAMVTILNENSASDGDIFPAMFRQAGLGPLIGVRSWGGVVGITNRGNLIDGGVVNVPEFGFASRDGKWIIEGYGVDPDIVVENDVQSVLADRDPQLERAIEEALRLMKEKPAALPKRPAPPVKMKR